MRLQPQAAPKSSQGFRSRIPGPARLSVERDKLHHARHRWQPPPLFQRGAHKAITRKQVQIQVFAAILPKTNRALKEERLQPNLGFPSQSAIHPFLIRIEIQDIPVRFSVSREPAAGPSSAPPL